MSACLGDIEIQPYVSIRKENRISVLNVELV